MTTEVHVVRTPDELGLSKQEILNKYTDVFQGLGELGEPLRLEVDEMVKPVQIPPRGIPEALRGPLKYHLPEFKQQGVIEKVMQATDWVSAIVVKRRVTARLDFVLTHSH